MLSIRLSRTGKIHQPHYRIVVQEKRSKLDGKTIDIIGHYHPAQTDKLLVINKEKAQKWLSVGAQPSDTVTNLMVKEGILDKTKMVHHFFTPTKKEEAKPEVKAEEVAAPEEPEASEPTEEPEVAPEETKAELKPEEEAAQEETVELVEEKIAEAEEPAAEAVEKE